MKMLREIINERILGERLYLKVDFYVYRIILNFILSQIFVQCLPILDKPKAFKLRQFSNKVL